MLRSREPLAKLGALYYGITIADVGHEYRRLQLTDCALCRILFASRIRREQHYIAGDEGDEVRLISFTNKSGLIQTWHGFHQNESEFVAVVPRYFGTSKGTVNYWDILRTHVQNEGAAVILQEDEQPAMFAAQTVSTSFEVDTADRWLHYCKENHSVLFGGLGSSPFSDLRLIDCATLSIREAEGSSVYAALSYIWGKRGDIDNSLQFTDRGLLLPEILSPVISDAIRVTKALGFQHLWVDKFCIIQDDPDAKHEQIQQMNAIYENSDLTIVAAAGEDETYGLPGVGEGPEDLKRLLL